VSEERWIVIPNWSRFQHYADRDPLWLKVYTALLSNEDYLGLSFHARGVLHGLWLEYARAHGQLLGSTSAISRRLGDRVSTATLESLNHAGFIEFSASRPLALARSREKKERRTPPTPPQNGGVEESISEALSPRRKRLSARELRAYTGCRFARGSHGGTHVRDPLGTERPPSDWPHPPPSREEIETALKERGKA
jgi:hypothetical protein